MTSNPTEFITPTSEKEVLQLVKIAAKGYIHFFHFDTKCIINMIYIDFIFFY